MARLKHSFQFRALRGLLHNNEGWVVAASLAAIVSFVGCNRPSLEDDLIIAAANGDVKRIIELAKQGVNVNCLSRSLHQSTPLIFAVQNREEAAVVALLKAGADPNLKNAEGRTPLYYALASPDDCGEIIGHLFESGALSGGYQAFVEGMPTSNPNRIAYEAGKKAGVHPP